MKPAILAAMPMNRHERRKQAAIDRKVKKHWQRIEGALRSMERARLNQLQASLARCNIFVDDIHSLAKEGP
jgi:hypothetical protein